MDDSSEHSPPLEQHARRDSLARLVRTVALSAADEQRARFGDGLDELLAEAELSQADGEVGGFNVLKALTRAEPPVALGREVLGRLLARGVALDPPADDAERQRVVQGMCWLAAHTYLDALPAIDHELEADEAARVWATVAAVAADADERGAPRGRGEALAAVAALAASSSAAAAEERARLAPRLRDPLLAALCRAPAAAAPERAAEASLSGELVPVPLGPAAMVFWTATGLILVRYLLRFIANVLLRCRRPVELKVAGAGVRLKTELAVLGRTVRTREVHIPHGNLARAVREVRYPRLALYAGLLALGVGTFVGVSLVTDGAIAGSPSLLALGAVVFAIGVGCDMIFSTLLPSRRGQHRVILVPRSGRSWAIRVTDASAADRALRALG